MLRDFFIDKNLPLIMTIVSQFEVAEPKYTQLIKSEALSPDSFTWIILLDDAIYYLYAEDYVPGLDYVKKTFAELIPTTNWELVKAKKPKTFETSSPVARASVYKKADDADEMMRYAVSSGHDFVFLARSDQDPNDFDSVIMTG